MLPVAAIKFSNPVAFCVEVVADNFFASCQHNTADADFVS